MAWFVHYWDEINNRNIRSSEIRTGEDAMQKACSLMHQGHVGLHAQRTNRGYLLYRCVDHWGQRRERRRASAPLGYTLSALHPP